MTRRRMLFLCTRNSSRGQMTEAFLHTQAGDRFEVAGTGTEATRVHPPAIRFMDEAAIDLRGHTSKIVDRFLQEPWDHVSSICDSANERCPVFPDRTIRVHWSFEDPSQSTEPEDQRFDTFRRARPARAQGLAGGDARGSAGRCDARMQMAARLATLAHSDAIARALESPTR